MPTSVQRDITVIGGSAGSLAPLRELLGALPADYPAAVFVVVHVAPEAPSILPQILDRVSPLAVTVAQTGARVRRGSVMVAPPDRHLVFDGDRIVLSRAARENRHRPSIDVLFRSAAVAFGARVTGVVLSGMLDDGAAGLWAVKRRGGVAVVQDPDDAEYPDMPRHALAAVDVDHRLAVRDMAQTLLSFAPERVVQSLAVPDNMASEVRMIVQDESSMGELDAMGERVPLACPECGGSLWELGDPGPRYRCHVGHAYTLSTLAAEQSMKVEAALWAGLRKLEESERLARRMESHARANGNQRGADYHAELAHSSASHAATFRALLRRYTERPMNAIVNDDASAPGVEDSTGRR